MRYGSDFGKKRIWIQLLIKPDSIYSVNHLVYCLSLSKFFYTDLKMLLTGLFIYGAALRPGYR